MKLRDFSRRIKPEDEPDFSHVLQGGMDISELTEALLCDLPETVYIANSQGSVFGKIQRETLQYLFFRQKEFRFVQILDNMNDAVIAVDASGRIFYANPAYVQVLGVPLRRVMGRYIQEVEPDSLLNQVLIQRRELSSEKQLIPSIKKYVSLRAMPLTDGNMLQGAVSIFHDITKMHRLDQKVRHMTDIVDEYSQRIRSQETAERLGLESYNKTLQNTIQRAASVALTDVPLLICGEGGTGKNVMARYLHQCSSRRDQPFISVNCAAVPADMIEGELFGSGRDEAGGKYALANGGTLFLDEIGELPLPVQYRLLYLLQHDLPERRTADPDVRLIAATTQSLETLMQEKKFQKDLFFLLKTITITLPPLRERPDDIIPMANQLLAEYNEKYHRNISFSSEIYQQMQHYHWPGNIRELKSYVERAVILADSSLPVIERTKEEAAATEELLPQHDISDEPLDVQLRSFERDVILQALHACGGNRTAAMQRLGISRRTFYRKCAELGLLGSDKK